MEPETKSHSLVWIAVAVGVLLLGAGYWYFMGRNRPAAPSPDSAGGTTGTGTGTSDLGGSLFEQAANPVQNKLPDTVAPVANPLGGAYKNPFE